MEYVGICVKGLEDYVAEFIKGVKLDDGRIKFNSLKDINYFDYVYELFESFKFSDFEDLLDKLKKIEISIKGSFRVKCKREGDHEFRSLEVERQFGEFLFDKGFKVDLKNPENIVFVDIVNNRCYVGLLKFSDLSRRDYRVKVNKQSIDGCVAYTILKIGNLKTSDVFVDPFCKDGTICIEASLSGCKNVFGLDSITSNVLASRLNTKIANANIEFIEGDCGWLSTKFKEKEVKILTSLPFSWRDLSSVYREFFKEAKTVAKGDIVVISGNDKFFEFCKNFKVVRKEFFIGKMKYYLGILS